MPLMLSTAASTTSAPALAHSTIDATPAPAVSCVCTWMGMSGNFSLSEPISILAASGFSTPAMSCNSYSSFHLCIPPHLDRENMCPSLDELLCQIEVVLQIVLRSASVRDIACVRNGCFHLQ
ncbi:hypothetical protein WR25_08843 [Diploscapter pachys]|uniref:Uncharacterized protein n=1 Tax=Diploscapter pachys TaxID=2018661 RepID=A0A2A2JB13_9BILA|nr:hypothetical protein WR25_08843 [Diploscapter pachys]